MRDYSTVAEKWLQSNPVPPKRPSLLDEAKFLFKWKLWKIRHNRAYRRTFQ